MRDLDRIEHALDTKRLSSQVFERCAQDLLSGLYEGLSPIPGGTDWGRDADISGTGEAIPPRLLVTSSRSLVGVRSNMLAGIRSMKEHGVPIGRIVLANPALLRLTDREGLVKSAKRAGVLLTASDVYDRGFFSSRLRRDGYWRKELLGLPSGPVTLSPVAPGLAESPWGFLPLVARAGDLASVSAVGDLIVTGPPGVGKSRLLSELPGAAFVDKDAPLDDIAADLRWSCPSVVIVDDAAGAGALIGRLLWLRRSEPDRFDYRVIVACWPPDVDSLRPLIAEADVHELGLMEREPLDELIKVMGIRGHLARREILSQAEGRPGWAVTLADLLLRKNDPRSLASGAALVGEAGRYLRRAGIIQGGVDAMAIVAALGGIGGSELKKLGGELQLTHSDTAAVLDVAARSGLIDVRADGASGTRTYAVRPPMLADALVAERVFIVPVPVIDLDDLLARWPDRIGQLARSAIRSAVLGARNGRQPAEALLAAALSSDALTFEAKASLCLEFMRLDRRAAEDALCFASEALAQARGDGGVDYWEMESVASLAARAAWLYRLEDAIGLLLDVTAADQRPENSHPGHPLRRIQDLVADFHPEIPRPPRLRQLIATCTSAWLEQAPDDPARLRVTATVVPVVLSLSIRSALANPGKPEELQLFETIVPAEEIRQVFHEIWSVFEALLRPERQGLVTAAIDVAAEWLRIGGGYDHPFGRNHPEDGIRAAREIGEALARALAQRQDLSAGNRARLRSVLTTFDVPIVIDFPDDIAAFFDDVRIAAADWMEAEKVLTARIEAQVDAWAGDDPVHVVKRLANLKAELEHVQERWPDRIMIATARLANTVSHPQQWLDASVDHGFLPEGCRFAERLAAGRELPAASARKLLANQVSRAATIEMLLGSEPPSTPVTDLAASALTPNDYRLLQWLMLRGILTTRRQIDLLERPDPEFRACSAVAIFIGRRHRDDWSPGDLEPQWLAALDGLRPSKVHGCPGHEMADLFRYLAGHYPNPLTRLIGRSLADAGEGAAYGSLPYQIWNLIHLLPASSKLELRHQFRDQTFTAWLLRTHMLGPDTKWLAELLEANEMSAEEAIECYSGFTDDAPVEELAKLLVPRGIDPERIAILRFNGVRWGDLSSCYQAIITEFEGMSRNKDPNVRLVAEAGVRIFTVERDQAKVAERVERVRGEL